MLKLKNILNRNNLGILSNKFHLIKNYNTNISSSNKLYLNTFNKYSKLNYSEKANKNDSSNDKDKNDKKESEDKNENNQEEKNSESKLFNFLFSHI
jgi:hypothetical protein